MQRDATLITQAKHWASKRKLSKLAFIGLLCMLVPGSFFLGPLAMSPSRLFFLLIVPVLTIRLFTGGMGKILLIDWLIVLHTVWLSISVFLNNPDVAVTFSGSTVVAIFGGYLLGRAAIRTPEDFAALTRVLVAVIAISLPFAVIESTLGRTPVSDLVNKLPGFSAPGLSTDEKRLGLFRAGFTFPNPIHYGLFASIVFIFAFVGMEKAWSGGKRFFWALVAGLCCFFSLSSGALLALVLDIILIAWHMVLPRRAGRWTPLIFGSLILYIILEILSDRAAYIAIMSRLAFVSGNVYIRELLLDYGLDQIPKTPWFGVGYNDWGLPPWMPKTYDNFWLFQALIYGIPAWIGIFGAFIWGMIRVGRRKFEGTHLAAMRLGWVLAILSMSLTLGTVTIWGTTHSMVMFLFASGLWMISYEEPKNDVTPQQDEEASVPASRYTRFAPGQRPLSGARPARVARA